MAQPFSAETLQLAGEAIPVATEASFSFDAPEIAASASSGGILVYEANLFGGGFQLCLGADMRFVAPDAQLSVMEIKWRLVPEMAGIVLMRRAFIAGSN